MAGLIINMVGAFMMYHYSPKVSSSTFLYLRDEAELKRKKDPDKNKMIRFGMLLLFIGFMLQAIALFIS